MNTPIEPWMLTAYLLGELEPDETEMVRAAIETDSSLQIQLQDLQQVIGRVQSVLQHAETEPCLTEKQAAAISNQIQLATTSIDETKEPDISLSTKDNATRKSSAARFSRSKFFGLAAMAASLLLAVFLIPTAFKSRSNTPKVASVPSNFDSAKNKEIADRTVWVAPNLPVASPNGELAPKSSAERQIVESVVEAQLAQSSSATVSNPTATSPPIDAGLGTQFRNNSFSASAPPFHSPIANAQNSSVTTYSGGIELNPGKVAVQDSIDLQVNEPTPIVVGANAAPGGVTHNGAGVLVIRAPKPEASAYGSNQNAASTNNPSPIGLAGPPPIVDLGGRSQVRSNLAIANADLSNLQAGTSRVGIGGGTLMKTMTPRIIIAEEEEAKVTGKDPDELGRARPTPSQSGDRYEPIIETAFATTEQAPLSTFSIDVDTASYSKVRQYLMQANQLPQPNAVRIEEMLNYFEYDYEGPKDEHPFASNMAVTTCPWNEEHKLVRIGLQAKKMDVKQRAKANLVFLLDVSGSMDEPNKLPLVKQAISMLVRQLGENDRIAMVVYAGAAGCVLPSITGDKQAQILAALDDLNAGGSTNGGQGIELAYSIAREHFIPGGINRVILCTDGDFNVGTTSNDGLIKLVQEQAKSKVFLTCLGFGIGNYNDSMMEQISNQGNGIYGMVDSALEARRMMVEQLSGTLVTVAKDVKIQIEFNPAKIASYRLIGYENRRLAKEDFNNDQKDAGEIGAGHRVTALYEVIPTGLTPKEELRYGSRLSPRGELQDTADNPSPDQPTPDKVANDRTDPKNPIQPNSNLAKEWLTLKLRYKQPEADVSSKLEFFLTDEAVASSMTDADFLWAGAVAEFGLLLRRSQLAPQASWDRMIQRARSATGDNAYRIECLEMMTKAKSLAGG